MEYWSQWQFRTNEMHGAEGCEQPFFIRFQLTVLAFP